MHRHRFVMTPTGHILAFILAARCAAFPAGPAQAADMTIMQPPIVSSQPGEARPNQEAGKDMVGQQPRASGLPGAPGRGPESRKGTIRQLPGTPIRPPARNTGLLEFASCHQPRVKQVALVTGKSTAVVDALHSHDRVALFGCGFGDQPGKVELLGRLLGSVANPFPERVPARVVEWRPNAILVEILPPKVPVSDQRVDILVWPPATPVPLPKYGIWWRSGPWVVPQPW